MPVRCVWAAPMRIKNSDACMAKTVGRLYKCLRMMYVMPATPSITHSPMNHHDEYMVSLPISGADILFTTVATTIAMIMATYATRTIFLIMPRIIFSVVDRLGSAKLSKF